MQNIIDAHAREEILNFVANVERPLASNCDARNKTRTSLTMTVKMTSSNACTAVFHVRHEVKGVVDSSLSFNDLDEAIEEFNKLV
jgi:hypothetical protein